MTRNRERGSAFLIAIFLMMVLTMLAIGVVTTATTDLKIADNYTRSVRNLYAADAAASHVVALLENDPNYGNITPNPSGTPLHKGTIGANSYSIWVWNKRVATTGTIMDLASSKARQFRVVASDNGRGTRRLEGIVEPARNYPKALDRAIFACSSVTLPNNGDEFVGPLYSGGNVTWAGIDAGDGSNVEAVGWFDGGDDLNGYVFANGAILNNSCDSGMCRTSGTITRTDNCAGGASQLLSTPPVKTYCLSASAGWTPNMLKVDPDKLTEIYGDTPTGNRLTTGWSRSTALALNNSYYYVTGGDVTFTGNTITYAGDSVIVVDGGNFVCDNCRVDAGTPANSTITVITRSGNMTFTGNATWSSARVVLWAGTIDGSGALPAAGNISIGTNASIDILGEIVALGGITSAGSLSVTIDSSKPPVFSDKTYVISEWHEVR